MIVKTILNEDGFTIVELLVSIVLLSIVIAAVVTLISHSYSNIFDAGRKVEALYIAQDNAEVNIAQGIPHNGVGNDLLKIVFANDENQEKIINVSGEINESVNSYGDRTVRIISFITDTNH